MGFWKRLKKFFTCNRKVKDSNSLFTVATTNYSEGLDKCIVCFLYDPVITFYPCNHKIICRSCNKMIHDTCPMCRSEIELRSKD